MKSLRHTNAGNIKLKGRRTCAMACGCCVLQNLKHDEQVRLEELEIKSFHETSEEVERKKHLAVLVETGLVDDDDGLPWSEYLKLQQRLDPEIDLEIWRRYTT